MPCYHKLKAWQLCSGEVVFAERGAIARELELPCGQCIGCRLKRSLSWTIRNVHESQVHPLSMFVTLTYGDDGYNPSLVYRDFQLFMKRLRRSVGPCRFFAVGEYGESDELNRYVRTFSGLDTTSRRPHFHALIYGQYFSDRAQIGSVDGKPLWRSPRLEALWKHGHSSFGDVTFQSAAYCSRYCCDKVNGERALDHYKRVDVATGELVDVVPEMAHMSLRPAIGVPWLARYGADIVCARDGVVLNGKTYALPRFYDRVVESLVPDIHSDKEFDRYILSEKFAADLTPERMAAREIVAKARISTLQRKL
ncbi:MAG: replication initiator protein [Microvirus sp.]|nr:MAG: replication initiator protein [Microvirus sp.]